VMVMAIMKQINLNAGYLIEIELRDRQVGVNSGRYDTECSPRICNSVCRGIFTSLFVATLYRKR
jgi:hypothetical protein